MRTGRAGLAAPLVLAALAAPACGGDDGDPAEPRREARGAAAYSSTVDHPLVPFASTRLKVFEGHERDPSTGEMLRTRVEIRPTAKTFRIAGVDSLTVAVREYEDGELVESTRDYYAQRRDGSVFYMGEHVDDYEDGRIVGHDGQWFAGKDRAKPGLFMPAEPKVGLAFEQERAPGVAEDRSTIVAVGRAVTTRAGRFSGCIKTRDFAPLDNLTESKYYCPKVGLVREVTESGASELVRFQGR